jgi:hypothetical protein
LRGKGLGRGTIAAIAVTAACALPTPALAGHVTLDHPATAFDPPGLPSSEFLSGGEGAEWELVQSFPTGNPLTDIDFFTQGDEMFMSAGTLGAGPNGGGQTLLQLTEGDEVAPAFVSSHPSASCLSDPSLALSLQHDVEATPKGDVIFNSPNPDASRDDTQLLIDATDAPGRCHDQGELGLVDAPQGGLEIIDVTDPANPVEIGFTSHIGEAHTVNVDPRRPHIAYAVTSDSIDANDDGTLQNTDPEDSDRFDLDGFEIVDLSSCMNFPAETSVAAKRMACRPEVFRYRYPSSAVSLGHTLKTGAYGCHELEVYPDDQLACASGSTGILFNMADAFDDEGTPGDFTDDTIRGKPLPCTFRESSSVGPFGTGAMIADCVDGEGEGDEDLTVPGWIESGSPSVRGVDVLGTVYHQGRGAGDGVNPAYDSTEDIDFNHEMELTESGKYLIASDERGGGVVPPGASCSPTEDILSGNGGLHAYRVDQLQSEPPADAEEAFEAYAETPEGEKAIFRVPIRTPNPQASFCTAHVFHQIPGQNRIFMGWYSQGTHVIDFKEHKDGTVSFEEAGYFIPENANTWVSAVFKMEKNDDGSFTYWGATGDTNLGQGRAAIDIYKVTLPAPPKPRTGDCERPIEGTDGADTLIGGPTGDSIRARGGNDTVSADRDNDCVSGSGGNDDLSGDSGDDTVRGGGGDDVVRGGDGKDLLKGNAGTDKLKGGKGPDTIRGGADADKIGGGEGNDKINVRGGGSDKVNCGSGEDRVKAGKNDKVGKSCEIVKLRKG